MLAETELTVRLGVMRVRTEVAEMEFRVIILLRALRIEVTETTGISA